MAKPKILFYDIETRPMEVYSWGLGEQHVGLDQIIKDWSILSYAAKWADSKRMIHRDQRKAKDVNNDKALVKELWDLLNEADIVVTQNGINFDNKKVNARFFTYGMPKPAPFKNIDTLRVNRRNFAFTSNKLAYITAEYNKQYKKLNHGKYPGLELWKECLKGNKDAWNHMKKYNIHDVLSLEEYYNKVKGWDNTVNVAEDGLGCRSCGSQKLERRGYDKTAAGVYQRYQCKDCGGWCKSSTNLLPKVIRKAIKRKV